MACKVMAGACCACREMKQFPTSRWAAPTARRYGFEFFGRLDFTTLRHLQRLDLQTGDLARNRPRLRSTVYIGLVRLQELG
jgi:hypothetical protein